MQGSINVGMKTKSNVNPGGPSRYNRSYCLDFRLVYELPPGKRLAIFGKIPEISNWNKDKPKVFMKPVEGCPNTWMLDKPIITNQFFFTYKYAIMSQDGKHEQYEKGIDRIADLEILTGSDESVSGNPLY